jgi:hypothetical protein
MSSSVESNSVVMDFSKASINDVFQKQKITQKIVGKILVIQKELLN